MRSIERRFKEMEKKNPFHSTYINFGRAISCQGFSGKVIEFWFNRLVDPDDYDKRDKKTLLAQLKNYYKEPVAGVKQG